VAKLRVSRVGTSWYDLGKLEVVVDGDPVGGIRRLERITVDVTEGRHTVMVRMKNMVSPPVTIDATDEDSVDLEADLPLTLVGIEDGFLSAFRTYEVFKLSPIKQAATANVFKLPPGQSAQP